MKALASTMLLTALAGQPALAEVQMTAAGRQRLVDTLSREVDGRYVFPETARKVAALTQEMQAASGDRHMRVVYSEEPILERKPDAAPSAEEAARRLDMLRSTNFGVRKIEHLPFNIGYLELDGFFRARDAAETLAAAMTVLAHTDALIIDLRNNGGGDAAASTLLASYLLDKRTHLGDFHYREGNRIEQRWKRATVVGETTGGGANGGEDVRLLPHFMPSCR